MVQPSKVELLQDRSQAITITMDVHEASARLKRDGKGIKASMRGRNDSYSSLDLAYEQQHASGHEARCREATETGAVHGDPTTNSLSGGDSRDDDMQNLDAQPASYRQVRLENDDLDCETRPIRPTLGTNDDFRPEKDCPTRREAFSSRFTWLNGTIVLICSVSTTLSAVFAVLALKGQRYGDYIGNNPTAKISISTAILWTSVVAKTIELTFVTGFVAFLGQAISRKAFKDRDSNGRGVTLSELNLWRWVVQPGTLVTQSEIVRYAGLSSLGTLTLLSTILSTLYVTAATALVQPVAKQSDWHSKVMVGSVKTDFANIGYIKGLCQLPISDDMYGASSCLQIDYAGKNYYNLATFLSKWDEMVKANISMSIDQRQRPAWIGLPYANTTVTPQWVNVVNTTEVSEKYQRAVNNVSLAVPHIGVSNAVHDQKNVMPQSETSDTVKAYSLWASVPSLVIRVLCTEMSKEELAPIVYDTWNSQEVNLTSWPPSSATTKNKTVVDDLFGWTNTKRIDYPPVFPQYPIEFNTLINHTSYPWGRPAIYLLGQGGQTSGVNLTGRYSLCKLEVEVSPRCSTLHSVSVSGSRVEALCDNSAEDMAYINTEPHVTAQSLPNWKDIGFDWANSLSLQTGIIEGNASIGRILMQLQLMSDSDSPGVKLNHLRPSLAETLAVAASSTLLASCEHAPFTGHAWVSVTTNDTTRE